MCVGNATRDMSTRTSLFADSASLALLLGAALVMACCNKLVGSYTTGITRRFLVIRLYKLRAKI